MTSDSYPGCSADAQMGSRSLWKARRQQNRTSRTALVGSAMNELLEELSTKKASYDVCKDGWECRIKPESK